MYGGGAAKRGRNGSVKLNTVFNKLKVDSAVVSGYNNFEIIYLSGMAFEFAEYMVRRLCPWIWK